MIISGIKDGRRKNSLIYVDGEYYMTLSKEIVIKNNLKPGDELNEEDLERIKKQSDFYKAKEKAFNLLSYRSRSKKELIDRIKQTSGDDSAAKAVKKMEDLGLVDDSKFAFEYANELLSRKRLSIMMTKVKLRQKGISEDIIEEIFQNLDINEEKQILYLLRNKFAPKLSQEKGVKQTIAALNRLGYSWGQVKSALSMYNQGIAEDELI